MATPATEVFQEQFNQSGHLTGFISVWFLNKQQYFPLHFVDGRTGSRVYSLITSLGFQYTSLTMPWSSDAQLHFTDLNPPKNAKKEPHPNSDSGSEHCQLSEVVQITGRRRVHYLLCLTTNPHVTDAAPAAHQGGSPQFSSFLQLD